MNVGDTFSSELHAVHLKPAGFKKKGRLFTRLVDDYSEMYQVQGSAWNPSDGPWRFYLNVGIYFAGLPSEIPTRGSLAGSHAGCRIRHIIPNAQEEYDVSEANLDFIVEKTWADVSACSDYFSRRHPFLRNLCLLQRFYGWFLDDPELRKVA